MIFFFSSGFSKIRRSATTSASSLVWSGWDWIRAAISSGRIALFLACKLCWPASKRRASMPVISVFLDRGIRMSWLDFGFIFRSKSAVTSRIFSASDVERLGRAFLANSTAAAGFPESVMSCISMEILRAEWSSVILSMAACAMRGLPALIDCSARVRSSSVLARPLFMRV